MEKLGKRFAIERQTDLGGEGLERVRQIQRQLFCSLHFDQPHLVLGRHHGAYEDMRDLLVSKGAGGVDVADGSTGSQRFLDGCRQGGQVHTRGFTGRPRLSGTARAPDSSAIARLIDELRRDRRSARRRPFIVASWIPVPIGRRHHFTGFLSEDLSTGHRVLMARTTPDRRSTTSRNMTPATPATAAASIGFPATVSKSSTAGAISETTKRSISRERLVGAGAVGCLSESSRIEGWRAAAPQQL